MITQTLEQMSDNARLWVYQSTRPFIPEEKVQIEMQLQRFVNQWAAHGQDLDATFVIAYDQFIVIAVDESRHGASGCSIDSSVGLIRSMEQEFGLSLLDRTQIAVESNERIQMFPFNAIKENVQSGVIGQESVVFNNSVQSLGDWKQNWKQKAKDSWMKRFFS
ncbi:hypothetical protein [Marinoscillum sp. MHG1-6]|uniref:hypothetical protein n=1 Tax=Marinoscillum sp. MHG1-6 TaxID=2959627 RepID=UPI0021571546|nr:hypothetical protein [Marinoscillum sp. MHG1-6]